VAESRFTRWTWIWLGLLLLTILLFVGVSYEASAAVSQTFNSAVPNPHCTQAPFCFTPPGEASTDVVSALAILLAICAYYLGWVGSRRILDKESTRRG
jgi:hypothetical protein